MSLIASKQELPGLPEHLFWVNLGSVAIFAGHASVEFNVQCWRCGLLFYSPEDHPTCGPTEVGNGAGA